MLRTLIRVAYRNLKKNKGYSFLNILGLAAGLTCFAFIAVWVKDEMGYDRFNKNASRIVRVVGKVSTESESFEQAVSSVPLAKALQQEFAEVENTVRLDKNDGIIVRNGDKQFFEDKILLTDPSFFDVFSYKLSQGDKKTALNEAYSIILTESMAKKYFGKENPLGKSLVILLYDSTRHGALYKITGVTPDPPKNAHFDFNFLASFKTLEHAEPESMTEDGWGSNGYYTYALLKDKKDIQKLQSKLPSFIERHLGSKMKQWKMHYDYTLQPLTSIHLHSNRRYEIEPTGSMQYIFIFSTIAIFILLIAAINYMNLATARSAQRAKEVGVKKTLGARRGDLILQYLVEAVVVCLLSLIVSFVFCQLLQPAMTALTGKNISVFSEPRLLFFLTGVAVLLGICAGLYPAFFLTAFKPVNVFKGAVQRVSGGVWLRKSLVISQFAISVVLIAGILVVNAQLSYIQHKDLGYKKDALLALKANGNSDVVMNFSAFKNDVLSTHLVSGVTTSSSLLGAGLGNSGATTVNGEGKSVTTSIYRLKVDQDYVKVHQMKIIAGRDFSENITGDSSSFIINEAAVRSLGWGSAENAINKPFSMGGDGGKVIGVINDFHFNSLQHAVEPLVIIPRMPRNGFSEITMRIDMSQPEKVLKIVADRWKKYFPAYNLEYSFIDKKLQEQYKSEKRFAKFFLYFSILSLLIACLGLLGLTAYATQQRTKEIGVRKVLGASVQGIVMLISKDFLKLVLIAALIAFPLSWWTMNKWLNDFAYRIHIGIWVFVVSGIVALFIALLTVGLQAIKAAVANPVNSLRSE